MLYTAVLFAHSWLRWIVVALAVWILVGALRARTTWQEGDARRAKALVSLTGLQVTLGLVLLVWLSPIAAAAWSGGFGEPALFMFGLAHPALMIAANVVLHVGVGRVGRAPPERRQRVLAKSVGAWLAIVALAIPWPMMAWGRPLARTSVASAAPPAEAPRAWARCVACHGATGHGDGPAAAGLSPRPRSFDDRAWQARTSDARVRQVIRGGGAPVGLSAVMPAHADLTDAELAELVAFIRAVARERR